MTNAHPSAEASPHVTTRFRRLRTDVGLMALSKALGLVFSIASSAVLARQLGPSGRGAVAVAFALALILVQVGTFGLVAANPYYIAQRIATPADIVVNSIWAAVALGAVMVVCGLALKLWLPGIVSGVSWVELLIALASIPTVLAAQFLQSAMLGLGRSVALNLTELAQAVGTFAALLVVLGALHGGVTAALVTLTAGTIGGSLAFAWQLRAELGSNGWPRLGLMRGMVAYASRAYVATLLSFLVIRLDLLLVNHYRGAHEAGVYSVAAALAQGMYVFPAAVGMNLFPRIAHGQADELTARVFRAGCAIYGLCCLATIPLVGPFISLLYGPRFGEATSLFYWLLPGVFSVGMLTVLANHFAGRGFPLPAMLVWFVGLAINLTMNVVLLPSHGTWVASLSSSVAYTLLLILHVRMFARDSKGYRPLLPRPSDFAFRPRGSVRPAS